MTSRQQKIMEYISHAGPSTAVDVTLGIGLSYLDRVSVGNDCAALGKKGLLTSTQVGGPAMNRTKTWRLVEVAP